LVTPRCFLAGSACDSCAHMEGELEPVWEQGSLRQSASAAAEATPLCSAGDAAEAFPREDQMAPTEHAEVEDFSSEPLEQRLKSRDLSRRCSAYSDAQVQMESEGSGEEMFALFGSHVDTALGETLPKGQDAALNALAAYLKHCPEIHQRGKDVLPWVRKLAEHKSIDKPKMQQLAPVVVLLIAEIAECPAVLQELTTCLGSLEDAKKKNAGFVKKQVAFIIKLIGNLLADFGVKRMPPKLGYLSFVLKYISDSDRGIREACYSVLVELAAWVGDISDLIQSMDEPQKKEVSKRLAEPGEIKKEPSRRYRGEASTSHDASKSTSAAGADDLFEKVDPFKKLPKGWCISAVTSMEKWKEKLNHLQVLSSTLEGPAERHLLSPSENYASLVPTIQRMLKSESNIPVLTEVAKCMGLVAKGLQKQFERFARQLLPVALARINDKSVWKPHCLIERVEQLLWSVPLDVLLEELPVHISSKSLFVKKEALHLLMRALELPQVLAMYPDAPQHFFHSSANLMMPLVDDSDNTVRQEAVKALAKLVLQNREAADTVLDRLPAHRRNLFEDEYRKLCKETPATPEPRVPTPLSPVITDRRTSPLKQLHTVTVESAPLQPLPSPGMKAQNADLKADKEEIVGDGRSKDGKAAKAEGKENRSDTVKEANPSETPLIKQMAEEIRNLRSKVKQLELDKERHEKVEPKAVDTPSPGPTVEAMNRLRAPASNRRAESAERVSAQPGRDATPTRRAPRELGTPTRRQPLQRSGSDFAPRPRDATPPRREATLRPATPPRRHEAPGPTLAPREATPTRREHSMRREPTPTRRREPTPTRREPTPTRREPMALRREPTPTRRDPSVSREATPRNDSTPSRRRQPPISWTPSYLSQEGDSSVMMGESVVPFQIALPRLSKQARQQKEKSQYWGPESIPSDHLAALREQWRPCIEDWLWRQMFSDRLEEQLAGLSHWQKQAEDYTQMILESDVLDMLLKWLVWMLWHANTKVWKSMLDVMLALLRNLEGLDVPLTDRETQILVPNIVERSGHNILAIREMMQEILRLCGVLAPRARMLPMLLAGLSSKSKRSAACSMKAIGDMLERQTTLSLLRSQKDLGLVLKLTADKDPEVRRSAIQTVALLSLHLDDDVFIKVCRGLPPLAKGPVQQAALSLQEECNDRQS